MDLNEIFPPESGVRVRLKIMSEDKPSSSLDSGSAIDDAFKESA